MIDTAAIAIKLRARLADIQADMARLEQATTQKLPARISEQSSDLETLATNEALEVQHIAEADQIRAALVRIDLGEYGHCSRCGGEIAPARLAALPTATLCIACAA